MTPNLDAARIEEMLPCPFCGGVGRVAMPEYPIRADVADAFVQCSDCDIYGPSVMIDNDIHDHSDWPEIEAEAVAAWNRRTPALRALSAPEPVADDGEAAAIEIADAVISWMVKHDLLDAGLEYRDDDVVEVLDDLIRKDSPSNPPRGEVKALEWRVPTDHPSDPDRDENVYCADGVGGKYAISKKQKVGPERLLWMADDPFVWVGHNSIAEAKAAAQADFNTRILSALKPIEPEISEEMVEAIKRIRDAAMLWTVKARVPEAGPFGAIAQDADWLHDEFAALNGAVS